MNDREAKLVEKKQIKDVIIKACNKKCGSECLYEYCEECIAEALYNAGYRKVNKENNNER